MIGQRVGGLALYTGTTVVGGIGLSGDTARADHSVAWRTRKNLNLQQPDPAETFATDAAMTNGHPHCPNDTNTQGAIQPTR
jgi:Haem-degrading